MVDKREKNLLYNFYFRQTALLFLYFFNFIPFFYSFLLFPYLFCFNFVASERNVHILFCRHIWAELSLLFWTFLSGTFSPGGGGDARAPSAPPPPAYAPCLPYMAFRDEVIIACSWIVKTTVGANGLFDMLITRPLYFESPLIDWPCQ